MAVVYSAEQDYPKFSVKQNSNKFVIQSNDHISYC